MFSNPLVAFDGSELSHRALEKGVELAATLGLSLRAVVVDEGTPPSLSAGGMGTSDARVIEEEISREESWASDLAEEAIRIALGKGVTLVIEVVEGNAVEGIAAAVERHRCDLLIVGLRHHPGLLERLTSRTAQSLSERVGCSVLGVR